MHNVINLCALFNVGVDRTCASNAVHKVPNVTANSDTVECLGCSPHSIIKFKTFCTGSCLCCHTRVSCTTNAFGPAYHTPANWPPGGKAESHCHCSQTMSGRGESQRAKLNVSFSMHVSAHVNWLRLVGLKFKMNLSEFLCST